MGVVRQLLSHQPDINVVDKKGTTPLMIATQNNHPNTVAFLIQQGADVTLKDHEDKTALDWAKEKLFSLVSAFESIHTSTGISHFLLTRVIGV